MKIIKNNWDVSLQSSCAECKSVIEIDSDDVRRSEDRDFLGHMVIRRYVICPVCKATLDFKFPTADVDEYDETLMKIAKLAERDDSNKSEVQDE